MRFVTLLIILNFLCQAGEISGRISIRKILTKKRILAAGYDDRGMSWAVAPPENKSSPELDSVVVYLDGSDVPPGLPVLGAITQKDGKFVPEMTVVPAGSTVSFPNSDPIFHNVFSLSRNKKFDLGFYPAGQTRKVTFAEPGIVQVYCHLHPQMNATLVVTPNSRYARPDPDGSYRLEDVPAGDYTLVLFHRAAGFLRKTVRVPGDGVVTANWEMPIETPGLRK